MPARKPEDWPSLFDQNMNKRDLEGVVPWYEPVAAFVPESGETIVGRERIRHVLAELIAKGSRFESQVERSVIVDDIALLYTNFRATMPGADKKVREVQFRAIEILRRQQDGSWKLIVGDPNAQII